MIYSGTKLQIFGGRRNETYVDQRRNGLCKITEKELLYHSVAVKAKLLPESDGWEIWIYDGSYLAGIVINQNEILFIDNGGYNAYAIDTFSYHTYSFKIVDGIVTYYVDGNSIFSGPAKVDPQDFKNLVIGDGTAATIRGTGSLVVDEVTVLTPIPKPKANAGPDQIICNELCNMVELNGKKSFTPNGNIESYKWQLLYRGDDKFNVDAAGETVNFSGLEPGVYDVILTITDDEGFSGTDQMVLTIKDICDPCLILKGDFDSDGDVDGDDLRIFSGHFGSSGMVP